MNGPEFREPITSNTAENQSETNLRATLTQTLSSYAGEILSFEVLDKLLSDLESAIQPYINDYNLVTISDIADTLGISRQAAAQQTLAKHFPKPVSEIRTGPLWTRRSIDNYL